MSVRYFDLVRWAWRTVPEKGLRPREALLLYLLVSHTNADPAASDFLLSWPGIGTLGQEAGYTVTRRARIDPDTGDETFADQCSPISDALRRLQELGVIQRWQVGDGRTARNRLLYQPYAEAETNGQKERPGLLPTPRPITSPTEERLGRKPSADAEGCSIPPEEDPREIRRLIRDSLRSVDGENGGATDDDLFTVEELLARRSAA